MPSRPDRERSLRHGSRRPGSSEPAGPAGPAQTGREGTPDCPGHGAPKASGSAGMPASASPNVSR
jgi:hypothetical protein